MVLNLFPLHKNTPPWGSQWSPLTKFRLKLFSSSYLTFKKPLKHLTTSTSTELFPLGLLTLCLSIFLCCLLPLSFAASTFFSICPPNVGALGLHPWLHVLLTLLSLPEWSHWAQLPPTLWWLPNVPYVFTPDFQSAPDSHIQLCDQNTIYTLLKFKISKMEPKIFLPTWFSFIISIFVNDTAFYSDAHSRTHGVILYIFFIPPLAYQSPYPVNFSSKILLKPIYLCWSPLPPLSLTCTNY